MHNIFAVEDFGLLLKMPLRVDLPVIADFELFLRQFRLIVDVLFVVFRQLDHRLDRLRVALFALVEWLDLQRVLPLISVQ